MQSSRDSSVWKSLAVAFGDGLAFGVGMKLTQPAGRASVAAPQTDLTPLAHRLEQMESRIAEIENLPRTLAPAERAAPQPFDQKVLEAVVNALDARLHEHAGQVERQITELQAKVAIEFKTLHQQDRSVADSMQIRMEQLQQQFSRQLTAIRDAAEADRRVMEEQISTLHHDVAEVLSGQFEAFQQQIREEVRQTVGNAAAMAASAADSAIEERLAPLRAAVQAKDREIAELRARLAGSDQATLDLLQGVGEICRRAAQRFVAAEATPPQTPFSSMEPEPAAPADSPIASLDDLPPAASASDPELPPTGEFLGLTDGETIPGFAQPQPSSRLWRVPLVSSLVLTTGVMLMVHYL
ncbi:conserved hypothetical protein [Candidatus Sulfopaludibacter sp. SbA3]|nr:conserved hypothetical protein [Candidatus Sulfopaludibacter sp. SbA3]